MLLHKHYLYRRLNIAADILIAAVSFLVVMHLKVYADTGAFILTPFYRAYTWLIYVVLTLWPLLLNINGIYPTDRLRTLRRAIWIICKSSFQGLLLVLAFLYVFKLQSVSRVIVVVFAITVTVSLIIKESAIIYYLRALRKSGMDLRNILVVGTIDSARNIVALIRKNKLLL